MDKIYLSDPDSKFTPPEEWMNYTFSVRNAEKIPDASCSHMFVEGTYFDIDKLKRIIKKIRRKGKITITGPDLFEISRNVVSGFLSEADVRMIVGQREQLYSCLEITFILQQMQLKVLQKRVNHNRFSITAERS